MIISYNIEKVKRIVSDFGNVTGLSIGIVDTNHNYIFTYVHEKSDFCMEVQRTETGKKKCYCSDMDLLKKCTELKKPVSHICHAGLVDSAVPIIKDENIVGYMVIGRIRREYADIPERINALGVDLKSCEKLYMDLPFYDENKIKSICDLVSYMLFENAIDVKYNALIDRAAEYIEENIGTKVMIEDLCKKLHVSKNILYKNFHDSFGCTVIEYIAAQRIAKAKKLLADTNEPIYAVAEKVGIENYAYFCRLFKKITGITPGEFRKL